MKKSTNLKSFEKFKVSNPLQIRGGQYWDTVAVINGVEHKDHNCPNGNVLIQN